VTGKKNANYYVMVNKSVKSKAKCYHCQHYNIYKKNEKKSSDKLEKCGKWD